MGSEQYAAQPALQIFSPFDTLVRENQSRGERAATVRGATEDRHSGPWKPAPPVPGDSPAFIGSTVPLRPAGAAEYVDMEEVEPPRR